MNDWAQSMFGMGFINLSGTCATSKIIQCYGMGISTCEVSGKFDKDPADVPDLTRADFLARKRVVRAVEEWRRKNPRQDFAPILYDWEVRVESVSDDLATLLQLLPRYR